MNKNLEYIVSKAIVKPIKFNSFEEALFCYNSDEYQEALEYVKNSSDRLVVIVEGLD